MYGGGGLSTLSGASLWAPSALPVSDVFMGYYLSKMVSAFCFNQLVRPTRIPPRQSGAARPCSSPSGGARQGPIAGYVLQSAAPAGPSP